MGSHRHFVALSFCCSCIVAGCGNLIGFGSYSVADDGGGANDDAGTGGIAGSLAEGGTGGEKTAKGGASGTAAGDNGAAGASGSAENGGSAGTNDSAGSGGAGAACADGCDDANECTADSCTSGACQHEVLAVGTACGVARSCDAQAVCVRCRDTATGTAQDAGCTPAAPICQGTGLDAACGGCTAATDCNDDNECTSEACIAGKCVFATAAAGTSCAAGVCNGTASAEKCVTCADTAAGTTKDAGCTSAKPLCEPGSTAACYECLSSADCATDNVSCTVETCNNHVCSHVATDSKCTSSADVCKPNKCDAALDCKQVDISAQSILVDDSVGNGSFELGSKPATGWAEDGNYWITKDCGTAGCTPGSNNGTIKASAGKALAWLGGVLDAGEGDLSTALSLPAGAKTLHIQADTNFQTQSKSASNKDYFEVRLMNAMYTQIGAALLSKSNMDAVTGTVHPWAANGVDVTVDVSMYAGKVVFVSFWSSCDTSSITDFYLDNVRISATVCQ